MIARIAIVLILMMPLEALANYPALTFSAVVKAPGSPPTARLEQTPAVPQDPTIPPPVPEDELRFELPAWLHLNKWFNR